MKNVKIKKNNQKAGSAVSKATILTKQLYENNVGARALRRAGKNKNLKGHVFEYMSADRINMNPANIIKGKKAVLAKSNTAVRDDIIIRQGRKIVGRMQLKDTPKGINDTVGRVVKKQYRGTNLVGTTETKAAYDKAIAAQNAKGAHITQKMSANGISSDQTTIIAAKALGGDVIKHKDVIMRQASKTGIKAGAISGGLEAVTSTKQVLDGEKSVGDAVVSVSKEATIGAVSASVGDATATVVTIAVAATPAAPAAPLVGTAAGMAASIGADKIVRNADYSAVQKYIKKRKSTSGKTIYSKRTLKTAVAR